jgi:2-polyprenyl-3-methyl-5-hydroxy-6-metoxy-1,4-benzoquinol methylase
MTTDNIGPARELEPDGGWRQHMHFDVQSRRNKARKIITLIDGERPLAGSTILEIGTGTGVISAELARAAGSAGTTVSIDTMDTRIDKQGYEFTLTSGVTLPFDDASFDVVCPTTSSSTSAIAPPSRCTWTRSTASCARAGSVTSRRRRGGR